MGYRVFVTFCTDQSQREWARSIGQALSGLFIGPLATSGLIDMIKATSTAKKIYETEEDNKRPAQRWFHRFKNGDLTLVDHSRSGQPPVWYVKVTNEVVENQPSTSIRLSMDLLKIPYITT
ncbi:hypothetical protein EVAR_79531_1 [Eumeta japonica]|uniref:Mos1 transposase HTH domain-containing protein n=1 Tax=Eumeta variegata TaxID=151549 RepID=A0A4C1Y9G0_EUMVA|nr:hypothetical protein EVAR_79531_1 [Eumeta japonica]